MSCNDNLGDESFKLVTMVVVLDWKMSRKIIFSKLIIDEIVATFFWQNNVLAKLSRRGIMTKYFSKNSPSF